MFTTLLVYAAELPAKALGQQGAQFHFGVRRGLVLGPQGLKATSNGLPQSLPGHHSEFSITGFPRQGPGVQTPRSCCSWESEKQASLKLAAPAERERPPRSSRAPRLSLGAAASHLRTPHACWPSVRGARPSTQRLRVQPLEGAEGLVQAPKQGPKARALCKQGGGAPRDGGGRVE